MVKYQCTRFKDTNTLKALMEKFGLSNKLVAELLQCNTATINAWKCGAQKFTNYHEVVFLLRLKQHYKKCLETPELRYMG